MAKHGKKRFSKENEKAKVQNTYEYSDFGLRFADNSDEIDYGDKAEETQSHQVKEIETYESFIIEDNDKVQEDPFDLSIIDMPKTEQDVEPEPTKAEKKAQKNAEKQQKRISKEEQLIRRYEEEMVRKEDKKKRGFVGFLKLIIPWKGDDAVELTRKSVLILALAAFVVSATILANFAWASVQNQATNEEIKELYKNPNYDLTGVDFPEGANETDFAALYIQNNDTVGWIHIPNTNIDNVVVKSTDNDFYLTHDFYKKNSEHGAIMADFRTVFSVSGNSKNVALYGHHMKDGSMFAELEKYRTFSFYKDNPVIYFDTLYSKGEYEIFSVFITNDLETEDNGYRFNFNQVNFTTEDEFVEYVKQVRRRSLYNTNVTVSATDEILTVSTCVYDFNEARLVICARRLLEGEQHADTSSSVRNPQPLYPQAWYDKKGGQKPTFDDTSSVTLPTTSTDSSSNVSSEVTSSDSSDTTSSEVLMPSIPGGSNSSVPSTEIPGTETPGTGTETPGTGTETPGTGTETPGTGTETPGTGTETPGTGTETPGTGTETPGTGTETPGTGTETPGTGTETPGTGTETPGTGTETPGTGTPVA